MALLKSTQFMQVISEFFESVVIDLGRSFRWSYLPPLMVYFAAGVAGITSIVGTFFIKEYLDLSAAFLVGLGFWAGIPWALKMPVGHLVDLIWRWKSILVFIGAFFVATSFAIMYLLIAHTTTMIGYMPVTSWYVLSVILAPCGFVLQDVVADAMTVESVPITDDQGNKFSDHEEKSMHTTLQTLGRVAIIGGIFLVSAINIYVFDDVEKLSEPEKLDIYGQIYLWAFVVPLFSISGVILGHVLLKVKARSLRAAGVAENTITSMLFIPDEKTEVNWWIFGGSITFVAFSLTVGLADFPMAQELTFAVSMGIILFLMMRLLRELEPSQARMLVGTAIIIFVFRATPSTGPGATWFEIDNLGFDQQFLSILSFLSYGLTLAGLILLRPLMVNKSIAYITVILSLLGGILSLPNIGLYYGLHEWTAGLTSGVVDARFIAIFDTALESPLGQISMIPMLAWIARNAPSHLKATFFAVMASFTNLALSASSLLTKYMNEIYVISREVKDRISDLVTTNADYSDLGVLMIWVATFIVILPIIATFLVQSSRFRTKQ